ncbi:flagellar hook assembly protein FlgD [Alteriqipengyuania lutimaris]|uniref:Basal-body rod modification protein FlgD n=1 Tax=Alteriqipengyuania lutimaris TaxID=1538146 RepID=A0A395LJU9_9SPHN|nr:flagellar hook capping FlgD N-terminal domain-containing protein [Alteriqipengyuania lutimaris]MBB3033978.1 flagellar basal-body rod modification protein FlgD [Alteriqipengyuania lutimaris]RDS77071.1 flagellar biosynthesis protein FlgD [Alteriqipengyuania lutimaris]
MITPVNPLSDGATGAARNPGRGMDDLGSTDFLRLLTVQVQQQDPFEPVDNTDMLAQMAQFSSLANSSETNATLEQIVDKLDALITASKAEGDSPAANDA